MSIFTICRSNASMRGEPIYINGLATPAVDATIERISKEAGEPGKVVQIVYLSTSPASSK
jgi:hypothetical protein